MIFLIPYNLKIAFTSFLNPYFFKKSINATSYISFCEMFFIRLNSLVRLSKVLTILTDFIATIPGKIYLGIESILSSIFNSSSSFPSFLLAF